MNELTCPITMDWLEYPITLPCCGRCVSREPMMSWLSNSTKCPLCNQQIISDIIKQLPKAINISYLVEEAKKGDNIPPPELFMDDMKATITELKDEIYETVIGKLEISSKNDSTNYKTLLVPIVDESGSMSGNPMTQVKYSLKRIVDITFKHTQLLTHIISYDDSARSFEINKNSSIAHNHNLTENVGRGGGTSFQTAFDELVKVCNKYKTDPLITSMVVIFLTDGEDSSVGKNDRGKLVTLLKQNISSVWTNNYIVHTVGFGASHDYDFLNNLRQIGTTEGAYRYADPKENTDILSNKINSLLNVIVEYSSVPIELINSSVPILHCDNNKYWINLTRNIEPVKLSISINKTEQHEIIAEIIKNNDPDVWNEWYSHLIDEIARELLNLSNDSKSKVETLDKLIHCEILQRRAKSILTRLDNASPNAIRLTQLFENIKLLQKGEKVDQVKLNDIRFEGKFATQNSIPVTPNGVTGIPNSVPITKNKYNNWNIIKRPKNIKRCYANDSVAEIFRIIGRSNTANACYWIHNSNSKLSYERDANGADPLIVASGIGRCGIVSTLCSMGYFSCDNVNKYGYNACDMAMLYGYWNTFEILIGYGASLSCNPMDALRTCLSKKYFKLAEILVNNDIVNVTEDLIDSSPNYEITNWLSNKLKKEISVETAIIKGMYDVVKQNIDKITNVSWKDYLEIFINPTHDHVKIVDSLLSKGKAVCDEIINIKIPNNNTLEEEITWPLFIVCEKGQLDMMKVLLKYIGKNKDIINRQNMKGTTILWIACCNKHVDVVMTLLNFGVDVNLANNKGDSPMIPCCQKGNSICVDMLLEHGVDLTLHNKNRDNCVLICCRTGQAGILEKILKHMKGDLVKDILEQYAEIDGFCPLLAATEVGKIECMRCCIKCGADIEWRTSNDNKIIPGATALHLACFYNRIMAVKVLIEMGCDVLAQTSVTGYTALHIAIKIGHEDIIKFLLTHAIGKKCMAICDKEGKLPSYYASNAVLENFFTNKLMLLMDKILWHDKDSTIVRDSTDVLIKYGQSLCCYEYSDFLNGSGLLVDSLLYGSKYLVDGLIKMGANVRVVDEYGVTPIFWMSYLGYNLCKPDNMTNVMLERVNNVSKNNTQNMLLMNVTNDTRKFTIENGSHPPDVLQKMNDGYLYKVGNEILNIINKESEHEQTLIGFIEKLKNGKVFTDGKKYLEYLLWKSKIHIIKLIASGEEVLNPVQLLSIYLYTSNLIIFKQINETLRTWNNKSIFCPLVFSLMQAITLLPPYEGEVYRAVNTKFVMDDYLVGKKLTWNTFGMTSIEWKNSVEFINKKIGIIFIIQSKNGRNISRYSSNPVDGDVIFLPGSEFIVTGLCIADIITLGQQNIRKTTCLAKETDIIKAINQQSCIIVELSQPLVHERVCEKLITISLDAQPPGVLKNHDNDFEAQSFQRDD